MEDGRKRKREDDNEGFEIKKAKLEGLTPLHSAVVHGKLEVVRDILEEGKIDVNCEVNGFPATPVIIACLQGHAEIVKELAKHGADLQKYSPLHVAAQLGHEEVVEVLLRNGVPVDTKVEDLSALFPAISSGRLEVVKKLLKFGADINALGSEEGDTPLHLACRHGKVDIVKELLQNGAEIRAKTTREGLTPLHEAVDMGYDEVVKELLLSHAPVDYLDNFHRTPLISACRLGNTKIVDLLIRHGANMNNTEHEHTPLTGAVQHGHLEVVKQLLEFGADVNLTSEPDADNTPLLYACAGGHMEIMKILLKQGAKVPTKDDYVGSTPLHMAAVGGFVDIVKELLALGMKADCTSYWGITPLHLVAESGHVDVAKVLIENGAEVNRTDQITGTPLMYASAEGKLEMVRMLLQHGGDVNENLFFHPLNGPNSPMHLAASRGHVEVVKELLAAKAKCHYHTLHKVCAAQPEVAKVLIQFGVEMKPDLAKCEICDVSAPPVYFAAMCEKKDVSLLEMLGLLGMCRITTRGENSDTPLHRAAKIGWVEGVATLLRFGSFVGAKDDLGLTPLLHAQIEGEKGAVEFLKGYQPSPMTLLDQCLIYVNVNLKSFDSEKLKSLPETLLEKLIHFKQSEVQ